MTTSNSSAELEFNVGSRCVSEGFCGTIRYVGEVPPSKGVWLGVEWDSGSRGRHSGDHEGVQYFTCRPGSGSFLRPKKVSLGYTLVEALQQRYGPEESGEGDGKENQMYLVSEDHHITPVEMVGAEKVAKKQSQYDQLYDVSLRGMLVSSAGSQGEIEATIPNLRELDLSLNPLLPSWEVVAEITSQLKQLRTLNLSGSRFLLSPVDPLSLAPAFSSVRVLFLNLVELPWSKVCAALKMMPGLEELHICESKITDLCPPDGMEDPLPMGLQLLNLEENQLSDWAEILRLQHLPLLKTLILNDNQIAEIFFDLTGPQIYTNCFPALEALSVKRNVINSWSSINSLACLPSLLELKFIGNPLLKDESTFTARQLVIARIGHLTSLNSSPISDRERQLAERYYLKHHASEWVTSQAEGGNKRLFSEHHPRYEYLAKVHGLPEDAILAHTPKVSALKNSLISVAINCPDHPDQKQLTRKLPGTMTVQKLKGLIQRLYKVDSSDQRLSYLSKRGEHEIEVSDDLKQLSFYSIESGDTILVRW